MPVARARTALPQQRMPQLKLGDDRAPFSRELLRAAQREREDGVGRVGSTRSGEDAGPGHVEVRQLVRLAVTIHHRVLRARAHDRSQSTRLNSTHQIISYA